MFHVVDWAPTMLGLSDRMADGSDRYAVAVRDGGEQAAQPRVDEVKPAIHQHLGVAEIARPKRERVRLYPPNRDLGDFGGVVGAQDRRRSGSQLLCAFARMYRPRRALETRRLILEIDGESSLKMPNLAQNRPFGAQKSVSPG